MVVVSQAVFNHCAVSMVMQQIQKAVRMTPAATPLTSHSTSASPHNADVLNAQQWSYHKSDVCTGRQKPSPSGFIALRLQSDFCGRSPLV